MVQTMVFRGLPITQQPTIQPTPSNDHLPSKITSPSDSANFQRYRKSVG
jgi:hypothetical protein